MRGASSSCSRLESPAITNPWDIPPLPTRGDLDDDWTFAGVGRVMSRWEAIEFRLARLYSVFIGKPNHGDAIREYGAGRIFRDRMDALKRAAETFFTRVHSQLLEGEFHELSCQVDRFADRRNEIAHGIVMQIQEISVFQDNLDAEVRGRMQYALIPPYYLGRKHEECGAPKYAYTSAHLLKWDENLFWLGHRIAEFADQLLPPEER